MIDFRYHLVSIIAVFLALAVGLIVGVTALSGPAQSGLRTELNQVSKINSSLAKEKQDLTNQVNADQAFAEGAADRLLRGLLTGQKVVLVLAPGADGAVTSGVTTALQQAGATVTGQVSLSSSFLDTTGHTESSLAGLAEQLASVAGVTLPSQSVNSAVTGQQDAAAVLAAGILSKDGAGLAASAIQEILSPFGQAGYLTVSNSAGGTTLAQATLAVLVAPAGAPSASSTIANEVLVALAQELQAAGRGTVMVAGTDSIGSGSAINAENSVSQVSTVDNADTESGQIMVAQALAELLNGGKPTAYGIGPGKAPSPAPTPSPSGGTTPKPSSTAAAGGTK